MQVVLAVRGENKVERKTFSTIDFESAKADMGDREEKIKKYSDRNIADNEPEKENSAVKSLSIEKPVRKYPVIEMKNVSFSYDGQFEVLKNLDLCLAEGESLVLAGESGAGKNKMKKNKIKIWSRGGIA